MADRSRSTPLRNVGKVDIALTRLLNSVKIATHFFGILTRGTSFLQQNR